MKSIKILFLSMFVLGAQMSFAQSQSAANLTPEQKAEMAQQMEKYAEVLDLSEKQKPQFEAITKKYLAQIVAVRDSDSGKFQKYKQVKAIRKNRNAEMEELLSKDQYEIYLEQQEEMQQKMKERQK